MKKIETRIKKNLSKSIHVFAVLGFAFVCSTGANAVGTHMMMEPMQVNKMDEAKELIKNKSFARAREILQTQAAQGNGEASGLIGEMHWFGDGTPVNLKEAEKWFKQGAEKSDAKSQGFINLIAQREARKGEISFYINEAADPKFRFLDSKCVTPDYGNNAYVYNQKLNTIWRKCYREFQGAIKQAKDHDQVVVPEDLLQILTEDEIKKVETNNAKIAELILDNMEKSKSDIDKAFVAWSETRRDEIRTSNGEKVVRQTQTFTDMKSK